MGPPAKKPGTPVWVWVPVGMLVLCSGSCGLVALGAAGNSKAKAAESAASTATASVPLDRKTAELAPPAATAPTTVAAKPKSAVAPAGSAVRDGQFEFVVTKFEEGTTHVGERFWNADAKGEFVLVYISVNNIGKRPQTYFASNQHLFDEQDRRFGGQTRLGNMAVRAAAV